MDVLFNTPSWVATDATTSGGVIFDVQVSWAPRVILRPQLPPLYLEDLSVLDLTHPTTTKEVKSAYRKAAFRHHPDRGGDADKFKRVSLAHERLTQVAHA